VNDTKGRIKNKGIDEDSALKNSRHTNGVGWQRTKKDEKPAKRG